MKPDNPHRDGWDLDGHNVPNPGSDEAIEQGCLCPRMDNARGLGWMGVAGAWVQAEDCPLHGFKRETNDA